MVCEESCAGQFHVCNNFSESLWTNLQLSTRSASNLSHSAAPECGWAETFFITKMTLNGGGDRIKVRVIMANVASQWLRVRRKETGLNSVRPYYSKSKPPESDSMQPVFRSISKHFHTVIRRMQTRPIFLVLFPWFGLGSLFLRNHGEQISRQKVNWSTVRWLSTALG